MKIFLKKNFQFSKNTVKTSFWHKTEYSNFAKLNF